MEETIIDLAITPQEKSLIVCALKVFVDTLVKNESDIKKDFSLGDYFLCVGLSTALFKKLDK